jgi:hypothetical protein
METFLIMLYFPGGIVLSLVSKKVIFKCYLLLNIKFRYVTYANT